MRVACGSNRRVVFAQVRVLQCVACLSKLHSTVGGRRVAAATPPPAFTKTPLQHKSLSRFTLLTALHRSHLAPLYEHLVFPQYTVLHDLKPAAAAARAHSPGVLAPRVQARSERHSIPAASPSTPNFAMITMSESVTPKSSYIEQRGRSAPAAPIRGQCTALIYLTYGTQRIRASPFYT